MRKEKNKARLHPTREQGPSTKRRKVDKDEYINIKEIWGKPTVTKTNKNKTTEITEEKTNNKKIKSENEINTDVDKVDCKSEEVVENETMYHLML